MKDILSRGGLFHSVMTGNSMTYWQSGRQDFCREIFSTLVEADRDVALKLITIEENSDE